MMIEYEKEIMELQKIDVIAQGEIQRNNNEREARITYKPYIQIQYMNPQTQQTTTQTTTPKRLKKEIGFTPNTKNILNEIKKQIHDTTTTAQNQQHNNTTTIYQKYNNANNQPTYNAIILTAKTPQTETYYPTQDQKTITKTTITTTQETEQYNNKIDAQKIMKQKQKQNTQPKKQNNTKDTNTKQELAKIRKFLRNHTQIEWNTHTNTWTYKKNNEIDTQTANDYTTQPYQNSNSNHRNQNITQTINHSVPTNPQNTQTHTTNTTQTNTQTINATIEREDELTLYDNLNETIQNQIYVITNSTTTQTQINQTNHDTITTRLERALNQIEREYEENGEYISNNETRRILIEHLTRN